MATTSLWHIEGRLKDLIAYVENPEKTRAENPNLQPLWDVFSYVSRPEATEQGEYVSAVNCLKEIALQQMILTKKQYGKENGYIAWHGYQSFKPGEVTPEQAHKIGLQLAKEMWNGIIQHHMGLVESCPEQKQNSPLIYRNTKHPCKVFILLR